MRLEDVRKIHVSRATRKKRRRVGRGQGSGWGTTAGRGNKGQGSRTGSKRRLRFEGGQMPLYRRLPKKGFSNSAFGVEFHVVNVGALERAFESGAAITVDTLRAAGLAPKRAKFVKVLGHGDLSKSFKIRCHAVSDGARQKVEGAGGHLEVLPTRAEHRPKHVKKSKDGEGSAS